jgi:hypothetical chaperone protein
MKSYGIDFGSTNSLISYFDGSSVHVLPIEENESKIIRSVIYVHPKKGKFVGNRAILEYLEDVANGKPLKLVEKNTGRMIKVPKPMGMGGYRGEMWVPEIIMVEDGDRGRLLQGLKSLLTSQYSGTDLFGEHHTLEDMLAIILGEIKRRADSIVGSDVKNVVLGRPVKYVGKDNEKLALERMTEVAKRVGFTNIEFELEPIGAALSYGETNKNSELALIFDFGGGTLDISIISFPSGKVLGVAGIGIGGDLINIQIFHDKLLKYFGGKSKFGLNNQELPRFIVNALQNWYSLSLMKTQSFMETLENLRQLADDKKPIKRLEDLIVYNLGFALYEVIDKTKKALSFEEKEYLFFNQQSIQIDELLTRADLNIILQNLLIKIENCVEESLKISGVSPSQINKVVLTGGSSLIPSVKEILELKFGKNKLHETDVFESVVRGLGIKARQVFS